MPTSATADDCPGFAYLFSMAITLYGNDYWTSPYVMSCFVTLREKGLRFSTQDVALHKKEHLGAAFAEMSLTSRVPALVDGDFALSESSAIIEYLDETYLPPAHAAVLPVDRRSRARARQLMAWIRSDLLPLRQERSTDYIFYPHDVLPKLSPLSEQAVRAAEKLIALAERMIPADGGPLFSAWTIADTELALVLQRLVKTGEAVPARLAEYANRQWARPSVVEWCSHPRPAFQA